MAEENIVLKGKLANCSEEDPGIIEEMQIK